MKRLLAIIISVSVVLSCCIIGGLTASAAIDFWDGTTKEPVDSNSDGVYEIGTPEELAWVAQNDTSRKYILTADIYVNDLKVNVTSSGATLSKLDGSSVDTAALKTWIATGPFCATVDGNGHTVSGLYNATEDTYASSTGNRALFGTAYNATVKNLRVVNAYFHGGTYGGTILAYSNSGAVNTVDNCYIENVSITSDLSPNGHTYPAVGGVIGYSQNSGLTVSKTAISNIYLNYPNCQRRGAILGDAWNASNVTVTNTYAVSDYIPFGNGANSTGNFHGTNTASNFYATVASNGEVAPKPILVSKLLMEGKNATISAYGLGQSFYTTAGYPMQELFLGSIDANVNKQLGTAPYEGSGTEADPYLIKTADDLRNVIGTYGMGQYYKLTNDIYLNDVDKINWATGVVADGYDANVWFVSDLHTGQQYNGYAGRGAFSGTLDGDGYSVHGLYIPFSAVSTCSGLVPVTADATIKNIAIKNSFMAGGHWTGGITGYSYSNTTFDTVLVDETVTVVGYDVGNKYFIEGWVDRNNPDVAVSPFSGKVSGIVGYESKCAGGIVGYVNGTGVVNNCAVYGTVRDIADNEKFTTTNPLTNGGKPANVGNCYHICGMVGTGWNSNVTISDCVSLIQLHDGIGGATTVFSCTDSYAQAKTESQTCCNVLEDSQMSGANALTNMPGLSSNVWTKTAGYPLQKLFTCLGANHADEHVWTDWAETTPPKCDVPGEETRECSVCGKPDSKPVTATGHDPATDWTKDAAGHWHVCLNNCGEKLDYAAHTFDQRVETPDYSAGSADCTKPAKFYFSCVCGEAGDQTFDSGSSMGHSPKTDWTSDANGHWHECANCDEKLDYATHSGGEATCTDKAVCDECDTAYGDVDPDNHDLKDVPASEASHDNDGNIAHKKCNDCGKLFDNAGNELAPEDVIVDGGDHDYGDEYKSDADGHWKECACGGKDTKADHTFGEWEVKTEPSAVTPGEKTRKCSVCGFEETAVIPVTEDAPDTGDHANALPWMAVAAFSMMALASVLVIRKRKA